MSQWTHVNGSIRFDNFKINGPLVEPNMSISLPEGSEGPITLGYTDVYRTENQSFVTVSISGDLRDFGDEDVDSILSWLNYHTSKAMMIRSGLIEIDVEFSDTFIYQYNNDNRIWELILTQPYEK